MLAMIPEAGGSSVEVVAGQQGRQLVQEVLRSVTQSCLILCDPCTVARQAPLSVGFSRQEHWTGLPCPPPGDLPDPGITLLSPVSPAFAGGFFYRLSSLGSPAQ